MSATWPGPCGELERRYRRLLLAYPGRYRRTHGNEIVTTLLEMADGDQTRPAPRDAWHLVVSGVRQRLRLPAGRPLPWVAAVLITVIAGAFGAAAGSWAAEQTFTDLPDDRAGATLLRHVAAGGGESTSGRSSSPWWTTTFSGSVHRPGWTPEPARDRLTADGWQVTPIRERPGAAYGVDPVTGASVQLPLRGSQFTATRDGLLMQVSGYVTAEHGLVSVQLWPNDTGALVPGLLAGGLLGLLLGWPVAAVGAYRMRVLPAARRRLATALTTLAVLALALPAFAFLVSVLRVLRGDGDGDGGVYTVHSALQAGPYWSYGTPWMLLHLTIGGLALAVAAWAAMRRGASPGTVAGRVPTAG